MKKYCQQNDSKMFIYNIFFSFDIYFTAQSYITFNLQGCIFVKTYFYAF